MYLISASLIVAGTGFLFWMLVARLYPTEAVGIGSALVSVMGFLAMVAKLGLEISLVRYLPETERKTSLVNSAITSVAVVAIIISSVFVLTVDFWATELGFVNNSLVPAILFVFVTTAETVRPLQMEGVFIGMKRAKYAFLQMSTAFVRIGVAALLVGFGSLGVYTAFGTTAVLAALLGGYFTARIIDSYRPRPRLDIPLLRRVFRYSAGNYVARTAEDLLGFLLPVLVLLTLGAEANAYFFIAWQMAALLLNVPQWITRSLLAEGSHGTNRLGSEIRKAILFTLGILALGLTGVVVLGHFVLRLFGPGYARNGYTLLVLLSIGTIPFTLTSVFTAVKRVKKEVKPVIYSYASILVITLGGGYVGLEKYGLIGIGFAWLIANILVGADSTYSLAIQHNERLA